MTAAGGRGAALATGDRVFLRRYTGADAAEFTQLVRESAKLHHPWMELPDTEPKFRSYLVKYDPPVVNVGLAVCELDSGAMAGGVNINNIVRGRFQSAAIGYWAFAPAAGRGLMSEGLRLVIKYAFGDLDLHRLEANIQPANEGSVRLVKRNGFRYEGVSPDYLFIDGAWRDHERWAITREMVS